MGTRKLLGELLLDARRITPEQLERALREQKETGERLGEILVATGQISREQLDRALARQRETRKRIDEILVEAGDIRPHQVEHGLRLQKKLATAALLAVLAAAGTSGAQEASRPPEATSAQINVTARIRARVTLGVVRQIRELVITNTDVAQGYVDVPAASLLEVRNNDPRGYLLVFEVVDGPLSLFENVLVRGLGPEAQIGPGSGWVPQSFVRGPQSIELSYRFILHKDAQPGTYAWPFSLSALPM